MPWKLYGWIVGVALGGVFILGFLVPATFHIDDTKSAPTPTTYANKVSDAEIVYEDFSTTIRCDGTTAIYTFVNRGSAVVPNSTRCAR